MAHLTDAQNAQLVFIEQQFGQHQIWWDAERRASVLTRMLAFYDALNVSRRYALGLTGMAIADDKGWSVRTLPQQDLDQVMLLIFGQLP